MYKTVGSDSSPQVCLNSHSVGEQSDEGRLGILSHKSNTETENYSDREMRVAFQAKCPFWEQFWSFRCSFHPWNNLLLCVLPSSGEGSACSSTLQ